MTIRERWRALFRPNLIRIELGGDAPTQVLNYTAKKLYQTQANLQAVVTFLADSIAQLPLRVFIRDGENDRKRDRDSAAAKLLWRPNRDQTAYEFIRGLAIEYFVYGAVYAWVLPDAESDSGWQLRIIPTDWVTDAEMETSYAPSKLRVTASAGSVIEIPGKEFVMFRTYSPGNPGGFVSPIAGLRATLTEQIEASNFRKSLWHSSGRLNAQIIRPKDVQPWDDETKKKWIATFREAWGPGGSKAGSIPLMEDGMEIKPFSTSFKEAQWTDSVHLSREDVAAAYHVNPSLIWHTTTQTYASAKDNARALYAECLGPVLQMLQQRINSFLLPIIGADPRAYVEFDLAEKIKGNFEERASILQSATGGPWMTRNEARADNNLPPIDGGDELIVPLNVLEGGQASPTDTHMDSQDGKGCGCRGHRIKADAIRIKGASEKEEDERLAAAISKFIRRQAGSVLPKLGAKAAKWWDADRWDAELSDDIEPLIDEIADAHGKNAAGQLGTEYSTALTRNYLKTLAAGRAKAINEATYKKLLQAVEDAEAEEEDAKTPAEVFEKREDVDAQTLGRSLATAVASWSVIEAVHQAKRDGYRRTVEKVWVTGDNPRPSHQMMDGETVPIDDNFSNGAYWPGDDNLDPDESCGCNCSTEIVITEE